MAKYHINKNGVPSACRARTRPCPLGGDDIHFNSKEEAQAYSDKLAKQEFGILPTELPNSEKERLLHHAPFMITNEIKTTPETAMRNIERYPKGTWLAISTDSGLSSTTTRFVKVGKDEWVNHLTLKGQLNEKPLSNSELESLINKNKENINAIGALDSNEEHLTYSEKERLLYHAPFMITKGIETTTETAMRNIERYPKGTWLAFTTKSGFSSTTTRFVKIGKDEWVNQLTLKGQLDEKPLSNSELESLVNKNKENITAIGALDSNRKYFTYSIEYYDDEDDICEINSSEIDSLHEAKELLKKELRGLSVKEWWIHNQDGKCIEHW